MNDRILKGILLMLGFCVTAPFIDMFSKLATQTLPVGQVTLARFVVQAALMAPVMVLMGLSWRMSRRAFRLSMLRAGVSILSTYTFVAAVRVMPLADALAIAFVEPFIILLLGWLFMGEEVGPRRLVACGVGFLGALFVIQPSFSAFGAVALFPLMTALFFALYILITRALAEDLHPVAMQVHTAWMAVLVCAPVLWLFDGSGVGPLDPVMPEGWAWAWMIGVGFAATVSHMLMTFALRLAPASTIAPFHYSEILGAVALGYLVFGDFPNLLSWLGILIITGSGLYLIHRERIAAQRRKAPPAGNPAAAAPASPGH